MWSDADTHTLKQLVERGMPAREIAVEMDRSVRLVNKKAAELEVPITRVQGRRTRWTPEMDAILCRCYEVEPAAQIAKTLGVTESALYQRARTLGLRKPEGWAAGCARRRWAEGRHENSRKAHFHKGQAAFNKGLPHTKWMPPESAAKSARTQFKPGRAPQQARNYQPIGTERFDTTRGVVIRKISDDTTVYSAARWRPVHVLVWEAANGPIPDGMICRFKDGMKTLDTACITTDRLELVTRRENMRRNSYHNRYPKEIGLAIQARGQLTRAINRADRSPRHESHQ